MCELQTALHAVLMVENTRAQRLARARAELHGTKLRQETQRCEGALSALMEVRDLLMHPERIRPAEQAVQLELRR